jgi:hypothetical protein
VQLVAFVFCEKMFDLWLMHTALYWWVLLGIDTEDIDVCLPRIQFMDKTTLGSASILGIE